MSKLGLPPQIVLEAQINANFGDTAYYFQYGTDTSYGAGSLPATPETILGATPSAAEQVSLKVRPPGLVGGVLYHYRAVAVNAAGTTYGPDQMFTAPGPGVSTGAASGVSVNEATLSGTIDPRGAQTSYRFEYGTETGYGTQAFGVASPEQGIQTVTLSLRGLEADTTYHYRLVVSNQGGTSYGEDMTFTTPPIAFPVIAPTPPPLLALPSFTFPTGSEPVTKPGKPKKPGKKRHGKKTHGKKKKTGGKRKARGKAKKR